MFQAFLSVCPELAQERARNEGWVGEDGMTHTARMAARHPLLPRGSPRCFVCETPTPQRCHKGQMRKTPLILDQSPGSPENSSFSCPCGMQVLDVLSQVDGSGKAEVPVCTRQPVPWCAQMKDPHLCNFLQPIYRASDPWRTFTSRETHAVLSLNLH